MCSSRMSVVRVAMWACMILAVSIFLKGSYVCMYYVYCMVQDLWYATSLASYEKARGMLRCAITNTDCDTCILRIQDTSLCNICSYCFTELWFTNNSLPLGM